MSYLMVENVSRVFGGIVALSHISFDIDKGQLIGLIGPNGAGKTTLFNCLTGVFPPSDGTIQFERDGHRMTLNKMSPDQITAIGFARTFQNIRLFPELSVLDNVRVAMNLKIDYHLYDALLRTSKYYREEEIARQFAIDLLERVHLDDVMYEPAKSLPYGKQRRLEIVRALATGAEFLFLDEPAAGMNPHETAELLDFIQDIHKQFNLTILLIEHDMSLVMKLCQRILVLEYGRLLADGTPTEIRQNPSVIKAYLGEE